MWSDMLADSVISGHHDKIDAAGIIHTGLCGHVQPCRFHFLHKSLVNDFICMIFRRLNIIKLLKLLVRIMMGKLH